MPRRPIVALLALALLATFAQVAMAGGLKGKLLLGAYEPAPEPAKRPGFNWELQNGFKEVLKDRVDSARELAVVLVGKGQPVEGSDKVEVLLSGGSLLPATVVVRVSSTVYLRNDDEVAHELYAEGLDGFSAEATSPRSKRSVNLKATGSWPLRDNLVTHVRGHLHVISDLVAVGKMGDNGNFVFENVTPGSYTLKVFHGAKEISSHEVEVTDKPAVLDPITLTSGDSK